MQSGSQPPNENPNQNNGRAAFKLIESNGMVYNADVVNSGMFPMVSQLSGEFVDQGWLMPSPPAPAPVVHNPIPFDPTHVPLPVPFDPAPVHLPAPLPVPLPVPVVQPFLPQFYQMAPFPQQIVGPPVMEPYIYPRQLQNNYKRKKGSAHINPPRQKNNNRQANGNKENIASSFNGNASTARNYAQAPSTSNSTSAQQQVGHSTIANPAQEGTSTSGPAGTVNDLTPAQQQVGYSKNSKPALEVKRSELNNANTAVEHAGKKTTLTLGNDGSGTSNSAVQNIVIAEGPAKTSLSGNPGPMAHNNKKASTPKPDKAVKKLTLAQQQIKDSKSSKPALNTAKIGVDAAAKLVSKTEGLSLGNKGSEKNNSAALEVDTANGSIKTSSPKNTAIMARDDKHDSSTDAAKTVIASIVAQQKIGASKDSKSVLKNGLEHFIAQFGVDAVIELVNKAANQSLGNEGCALKNDEANESTKVMVDASTSMDGLLNFDCFTPSNSSSSDSPSAKSIESVGTISPIPMETMSDVIETEKNNDDSNVLACTISPISMETLSDVIETDKKNDKSIASAGTASPTSMETLSDVIETDTKNDDSSVATPNSMDKIAEKLKNGEKPWKTVTKYTPPNMTIQLNQDEKQAAQVCHGKMKYKKKMNKKEVLNVTNFQL